MTRASCFLSTDKIPTFITLTGLYHGYIRMFANYPYELTELAFLHVNKHSVKLQLALQLPKLNIKIRF